MSVVCVQDQGARIGRRGSHLLVERDGEELAEIQLRETTALAIIGGVQLGTQALERLLEEGIGILFFTRQGRLKSLVAPPGAPRLHLRVQQYEALSHPSFLFETARRLVGARILNSVALLEAQIGEAGREELVPASERLLSLAMRSTKATGLEVLRECLTSASEVHYAAFPVPPPFAPAWPGCLESPARDPVNALLELGFVLTLGEMRAQIEAQGFDPYAGILMEEQDGRPALALDLIEPFRAAAADRLALKLMHSGTLTPEMFQFRADGRGGLGLTPQALPLFLSAWDTILTEPLPGAPDGLRAAMGVQVDSLERALEGAPFEPFFLRL